MGLRAWYRLWVISTIREKIKRYSLTTVIPVVFLFGGIVAHAAFSGVGASSIDAIRHTAILGGPDSLIHIEPTAAQAVIEPIPFVAENLDAGTSAEEPFMAFEHVALVERTEASLGAGFAGRSALLVYTVQKGDNLSKIAAHFGVSLDTILNANPGIRTKALQVGQELVVLPISGVMHLISKDDTLSSIAEAYRVSPSEIVSANKEKMTGNTLPIGEQIIIPGARVQGTGYALTGSLQNLVGYFAAPAAGWNWGTLHANNAVDIANTCGTPIFSSAEGLVVKTGDVESWNGGYGGFIEIEHPNGTETLYGHLSEVFVSVGDYVSKKEQIALMGSTGNTHGPTGCHLHFEVHGAKNPFAK